MPWLGDQSADETAAPDPAFQTGMALAQQAAGEAQTAQTVSEWQAVVDLWVRATGTLLKVPSDDVNAAQAQQKLPEYEERLIYARQQLKEARADETVAPDPAFQAAMAVAQQAAQQTQTAQTRAEWQAVANLWVQAIETLLKVPNTDVNAPKAQQKVQEYQQNLNYARQRLAAAP
jgi:hypothetical protein